MKRLDYDALDHAMKDRPIELIRLSEENIRLALDAERNPMIRNTLEMVEELGHCDVTQHALQMGEDDAIQSVASDQFYRLAKLEAARRGMDTKYADLINKPAARLKKRAADRGWAVYRLISYDGLDRYRISRPSRPESR